MLQRLKRLFDSGEPGRELPGLERRHLQICVAVLLHEARRADYEHKQGESDVAERALRELFGMGADEAGSLLKEGRAKAEQLTSFYAPVSVIKRDFPMQDRIRLIEHLWRISFADGQLNLYEDHYVRKIAHLLYVPNTDSMLARNRAKQSF
jgi:uncharacterized tellurite resistance protein B-like protein